MKVETYYTVRTNVASILALAGGTESVLIFFDARFIFSNVISRFRSVIFVDNIFETAKLLMNKVALKQQRMWLKRDNRGSGKKDKGIKWPMSFQQQQDYKIKFH